MNQTEIDNWPSESFVKNKLKNYKQTLNGIIIPRQFFTDHTTIGRMIIQPLNVEGFPICDTLEDRYRDLSIEKKVDGETCIPYGVYYARNISGWGSKNLVTPYLFYVPFFSGIRIHIGNDDSDVRGCISVGYNSATNFIKSSGIAFTAMMEQIKDWPEYYVEIFKQKIDN